MCRHGASAKLQHGPQVDVNRFYKDSKLARCIRACGVAVLALIGSWMQHLRSFLGSFQHEEGCAEGFAS